MQGRGIIRVGLGLEEGQDRATMRTRIRLGIIYMDRTKGGYLEKVGCKRHEIETLHGMQSYPFSTKRSETH